MERFEIKEALRGVLLVDACFVAQRDRRCVLLQPSESEDSTVGERYLIRRSNLMQRREHEVSDTAAAKALTRRQAYLHMRTLLQLERYGMPADDVFESKLRLPRSNSMENVSLTTSRGVSRSPSTQQLNKLFPAASAPVAGKPPGGGLVTDAYSFTGMHHIFCDHSQAITCVVFAHNDRDLLAFSSADGTITIGRSFTVPESLRKLRGHTGAVNDLCWSSANDMLLSASADGSVRAWKPSTGAGLRALACGSAVHAVRFHPLNNNWIVAATEAKQVLLFNMSTGKLVRSTPVLAPATALDFDAGGRRLFVSDAKGTVYVFDFNSVNGECKMVSRMAVCLPPARITGLQSHVWHHGTQHDSELLVDAQDNRLRLLSVSPAGVLVEKRSFPTRHSAKSRIRSCFCPLISQRDGQCVVTGSEDMGIYILDVRRQDRANPVVNQLQGHGGVVTSVAWAYDESLLASGDSTGTVILWKRVQMASASVARPLSRLSGSSQSLPLPTPSPRPNALLSADDDDVGDVVPSSAPPSTSASAASIDALPAAAAASVEGGAAD